MAAATTAISRRSMTPVNPPGIGISPIADVGMRQRVGRLSISQTMES
jgi:hypothetical protein